MNRSRRPLIAGNWKLNNGGAQGLTLAGEIAKRAGGLDKVDVVVSPPFTALAAVAQELGSRVTVSAQNVYPKDSGAFTGEVSAPMLVEAGAKWVIIGHSERRQFFGETDATVAEKVAAVLAKGLRPIACVGETLAEREKGETLAVVSRQIDAFIEVVCGTARGRRHRLRAGLGHRHRQGRHAPSRPKRSTRHPRASSPKWARSRRENSGSFTAEA